MSPILLSIFEAALERQRLGGRSFYFLSCWAGLSSSSRHGEAAAHGTQVSLCIAMPWTSRGYSSHGPRSGDPSAALDAGSAAASEQAWISGFRDPHHSQG